MRFLNLSFKTLAGGKNVAGLLRQTRFAVFAALFLISGCAYYNTLFNAKNSYKEGLKAIQESSDQKTTPQAAKKHFEDTIDKCWKLIELYSDKSKYADDALLYIGKSEFYLERYAQSEQHLKQFIQKYPESNLLSEAHLWYAKVLLKENEVEKANEYFLLVINNAKEAQLRSEANLSLGLYAFENENYDQSIDYFQRALKENINDEYKALLHHHLGEAYYIQKEYKSAVEQYKKVENFNPTVDVEFKSKLHLAKSYSELEKYNDAERLLKKMLTAPRFQVNIPVIKSTLGEVYERQDRIEEAVDIYTEVVKERKPGEGTAQAAYDLAHLYETYYHNIDSAVVYYGKVSQLYAKFDSADAANKKKGFLSEFKGIRDKINYEEKLVYRLKNEPSFRDSLYKAQYEDSLEKLSGASPQQQEQQTTEEDSLLRWQAYRDSVALGLIDTTAEALADSLQNQEADSLAQQSEEDIFQGFRNTGNEPEVTDPLSEVPQPNTGAIKPEEEKKPIEKRKLPQIEFDLMNNRFHLAEFYLLKEQNYDSAAYHYHKFLETYEDSILSPKALYSLIYIYKSPGHKDPQKVEELEKQILDNYPNSVFARHILRGKGLLKEEEPPPTPEEEAEELFLQAESLYFAGELSRSVQTYNYIASLDTSWLISAKAQYAAAWIYEHDLVMRDSALAAYQKLVDNYPTATDYVKVAKKKTTPVTETEKTTSAVDTSSQAGAAPDSAALVPGGEITAGAAAFVVGSEDILQEKIRWRIRRDRVGLNQRE